MQKSQVEDFIGAVKSFDHFAAGIDSQCAEGRRACIRGGSLCGTVDTKSREDIQNLRRLGSNMLRAIRRTTKGPPSLAKLACAAVKASLAKQLRALQIEMQLRDLQACAPERAAPLEQPPPCHHLAEHHCQPDRFAARPSPFAMKAASQRCPSDFDGP